MAKNLEATIRELLEPLIAAEGLALWGLDIVPGPTLKVAVYVDVPLAQAEAQSASIDQCESISRQLGLALDVEDCISQPWVLEVSSPGLERKFFTLDQMRPYIGDMVEARLKPGSARKVWRGKLARVGEADFEIQPASISDTGEVTPDKESPVAIPWDSVSRVKRIHIFTVPRKPGKSGAPKKPARK